MTDPVMMCRTSQPAVIGPNYTASLTAYVPEDAVAEFTGDHIGEYDWDASVGALASLRARKNGYRPIEIKKIYREEDEYVVKMEARQA